MRWPMMSKKIIDRTYQYGRLYPGLIHKFQNEIMHLTLLLDRIDLPAESRTEFIKQVKKLRQNIVNYNVVAIEDWQVYTLEEVLSQLKEILDEKKIKVDIIWPDKKNYQKNKIVGFYLLNLLYSLIKLGSIKGRKISLEIQYGKQSIEILIRPIDIDQLKDDLWEVNRYIVKNFLLGQIKLKKISEDSDKSIGYCQLLLPSKSV